MKILVLNRNNLEPGNPNNNRLIYTFPSSITFKDQYVAVSSISMYYSWFNITQEYQNNTLTYTWTYWDGQGDVTNTYTITIPDGLYQVADINQYCQFVMINNGTYWIDSNGDYVYPFDLAVNPTRYAVQLNTYLIPDTLPTGASVPSNFPGWPGDPQNSVVTTPANFCDLIGFASTFSSDANVNDSYTPPAGQDLISKNGFGTISYLSTSAPNIQPNSNLLISMSNINNDYGQNTGVIYAISPNVRFGEQITEKPPQFIWNKMLEGTYNKLTLSILGTDFSNIKINDPNITILLTIADRNEIGKLD